MAEISEVSDVLNIITQLKGGESTKTKQTQQTHISDDGVNELINNILAGPGGVKQIGAATKRAGVFNSTVQEAALNDLHSSAAVKAELARSPTTNNSTVEQEGGAGVAELVGALTAASTLKSMFTTEAAAGAVEAGTSALVSGGGAPIVEGIGTLAGGVGVDAASQIAATSSGVTLGTVPAAANLTGSAATSTGSAAATGGSAGVSGTSSGLMSTGNMVSGGLSVLSGLMMGRDASNDPGTLIGAAGMGAMAGGPVGAAIAVVGTILGGQLAGSGSFSPMKGIKTGLKSIGKIFGF